MVPVKHKGIIYYTVCVSDLARSIAWYNEKLGFTVTSKTCSNRFQKVVFITNRSMKLKLVQPAGARPLPLYRSHPGTDNAVKGNKHFSFRVDNGPQAEKEIRALNIPVVAVPVVRDTYGIFICDSTGNLMEILQEEKPKVKTVPTKNLGSYPIPVKTWSHIAISVTDMKSSVKWYGAVLGFTLSHTDEIPTPAGNLKVTWLNAPNFCLEIFEVPGAKPVPPDRLDPATDLKTLGNKYLTLGVTDINKTAAELKRLEVGIISRRRNSIFIRDEDGILIELADRPDRVFTAGFSRGS